MPKGGGRNPFRKKIRFNFSATLNPATRTTIARRDLQWNEGDEVTFLWNDPADPAYATGHTDPQSGEIRFETTDLSPLAGSSSSNRGIFKGYIPFGFEIDKISAADAIWEISLHAEGLALITAQGNALGRKNRIVFQPALDSFTTDDNTPPLQTEGVRIYYRIRP